MQTRTLHDLQSGTILSLTLQCCIFTALGWIKPELKTNLATAESENASYVENTKIVVCAVAHLCTTASVFVGMDWELFPPIGGISRLPQASTSCHERSISSKLRPLVSGIIFQTK